MKAIKKKNMFWAALSMTAALVMTACSSDNDITETPAAPQAQKTIPYTVTVTDDATTTRATVKDDPTDRQLYFATGDKLYITGTNIKGVLDLQAGDEGKASGATFSGELTYDGSGSPADDLQLTATLVSAQQTDGEEVTINATTGAVTVKYPTTAYCSSINDAVQKYSNLTGTSTYGARAFTLTQQTAFLNFEITFEDGTATGTSLSAKVNNNSLNICTANVTTTTESTKVVAKFVLPVAASTTLSSANVKMGDKEAISFGASQELTGKVYNVKKTQVGAFKINAGGTQVRFAQGNLQATWNGSTWSWAFATNQWDYIGNAAGNTSINGNGTVSANNVTVDLFGWVGASSTWTGAAQYGISNSNATNNTNGYGNNASEALKSDWGNTIGTGWRTLTSAEWTYVFKTRNGATSVNGTANARYTHATINTDGTSVNGMILFPDGVTIANSEATSWGTINGNSSWGTQCTSAQWTALAAKGCVFLPVAGSRGGSNVSDVGTNGNYWSSSPYTSNVIYAYSVRFKSSSLTLATSRNRNYGTSVRLVRQVE